MGAGLSFAEEARDGVDADGLEKAPQVNVRYLHWLLSDPARIAEAFKPVWRACGISGEQTTAPKGTVLKVMLRVVQEFERTGNVGGNASVADFTSPPFGNGGGVGRTARQLVHVVDSLPDWLSRQEALHLFRTALLSVQAALAASRVGEAGSELFSPSPQSGSYGEGSIQTPSAAGDLPDGSSLASTATGPGSFPARSMSRQTPGAEDKSDSVPLSRRVVTRQEDLAVSANHLQWASGSVGRPRRSTIGSTMRHPALAVAPLPLPGSTLPSRQELEVENEQLVSLTELLEASAREEQLVVRGLEEEASTPSGSAVSKLTGGAGAGGDNALFAALEARTEAAEQEIDRLEAQIRQRDVELAAREAIVSGQQRGIATIVAERSAEEATAEELGREAREMALELKTCRRQCAGLESEIASEEARAMALREAFEGRRARFNTAETAARNAELSTMRATRRRIAAEASARREASAVEEAKEARGFAASQSSARVEVLSAEIAEVRFRTEQAQALLNSATASGASAAGRRALAMSQAAVAVQATLRDMRAELAQAELERDHEVAIADDVANQVAELEVIRARAEGQLANREGELRVARRRAERVESMVAPQSGVNHAPEDGEVELDRVANTLREVEARVEVIRRQEVAMQGEASRQLASTQHQLTAAGQSTVEEEERAAEDAWREARELGAELGEVRAALLRRQAEETNGVGEGVVASLRAALTDAQKREMASCAELDEVQGQVLAGLSERQDLQHRVAAVEVGATNPLSIPPALDNESWTTGSVSSMPLTVEGTHSPAHTPPAAASARSAGVQPMQHGSNWVSARAVAAGARLAAAQRAVPAATARESTSSGGLPRTPLVSLRTGGGAGLARGGPAVGGRAQGCAGAAAPQQPGQSLGYMRGGRGA